MKRRRNRKQAPRGTAALLYYWKSYSSDTKRNEQTYGFKWVSHLQYGAFERFRKGIRVWAITRIKRGKYALVAKFVVDNFGLKSRGTGKRIYFFRGNRKKSEFFAPEEREGFERLVRKLSFSPQAEHLGMAFQGVNSLRHLTPKDNETLANYARSLISQRGQLKPLGNRERKAINNGPPEWREVVREIAKRNSSHVKGLKEELDGICQLCGTKPFGGEFGDITEAHHIIWLSDDGADRLDNMILLCPNHHAAVHATRAKFDRSRLRFFFGDKSVYVKQTGHLKKSARLQAQRGKI